MTDTEYINAEVKKKYPSSWLKNLTNVDRDASSIDENYLNATIADALGHYYLYYSNTYTQGDKTEDALIVRVVIILLNVSRDSSKFNLNQIETLLRDARRVQNKKNMTVVVKEWVESDADPFKRSNRNNAIREDK